MAQDDAVARAVGAYLRRLREAARISLSQVVRLLREEGVDLSTATLSRVEQGRTILRMDLAQPVVERLGGTFEELGEVIRAARAASIEDNPAKATTDDPAAAQAEARRLAESGRYVQATRLLERLAAQLADSGETGRSVPGLLPSVRIDLGDMYRRLRMYQRSFRELGEALNSRDILPEDRFRAVILHLAGCYMTGDRFRGEMFARYIREHLSEWTDSTLHPLAIAVLASFAYFAGDHSAAAEDYLRAAQEYRERGQLVQALQTETSLADCLDLLGKHERALVRLREVIKAAGQNGWKQVEGRARHVLGDVLRRHGRYGPARQEYSRAARIARELGLHTELFLAIHGLWKVAVAEGAETRARQEAAALRNMLPTVDPHLPQVREFRRHHHRAPGGER